MYDLLPNSSGIINFMAWIGSIIAFLGGAKLYDMSLAFLFDHDRRPGLHAPGIDYDLACASR